MTLKCPLILVAICCAMSALGQFLVPDSSVRQPQAPWLVHSDYVIFQGRWLQRHVVRTVNTRGGQVQGNYPADIRAAYGLPASGGSQAIAIIEAYDLPTSLNDFNVFASQFSLPVETSGNSTASTNSVFQVVYANGTRPASNPSWGGEIALDMEWAHAIAPQAKIYVIECASDNFSDILVGVQAASKLPDVREVSMSFGSAESAGELSYDTRFTASNQVYFAAAGDTSNELDYPAASPNVVGVGGTTLNTSSTGVFLSETAWSSGAGGKSAYESQPAYQLGFTSGVRGVPDVAADADPNTGCAVYDSTPIPHEGSGWMVDGGTSLATPIAAGIANLRGSFSVTSFDELVRQYGLAGGGNIRDIVTGTSGANSAGRGYDYVTGLGAMFGLYPTSVYAPSLVVMGFGTIVGGVPDNMIVRDDHDFLLRSVQQLIQFSGTFSTSLAELAPNVTGTLSVTGFSTGGITSFSLFNQNSQNWDTITDLAFGASGGSITVSIPNLGTYVGAQGNIQFRINSQPTGGSPATYLLGLDQVQLGTTVIN